MNLSLSQLLRSSMFLFLIAPLFVFAQPSGSPYRPIEQTYTVPRNAGHVYCVAPDGKRHPAPSDRPTTLEAAIAEVVTGDAIILRGGVYRTGGLMLNQGITLQPYGDEHPILKGTQVATNWEALRDNVWRILDAFVPQKPAYCMRTA